MAGCREEGFHDGPVLLVAKALVVSALVDPADRGRDHGRQLAAVRALVANGLGEPAGAGLVGLVSGGGALHHTG